MHGCTQLLMPSHQPLNHRTVLHHHCYLQVASKAAAGTAAATAIELISSMAAMHLQDFQCRPINKLLARVQTLDRLHHTCPREVGEASTLEFSRFSKQMGALGIRAAGGLQADTAGSRHQQE
jgi:hypothetical protein